MNRSTTRFTCLFTLLAALLFCTASLSAQPTATAAPAAATDLDPEPLGAVEKINGLAFIYRNNSVRPLPVRPDAELFSGDVISTMSSSSVTIKIIDGSVVILSSGSRMRFRSPTEFHHERGVAYYDIVPRMEASTQRVAITTDFAIAGVKGTEFIINADAYSPAISLNTGSLDITSPDAEDYKVVQRKEPSFEDFQQQRQQEFSEWKSRLVEEFVEYKRQFTLSAGNEIRFNGKTVTQDPLDSEISEIFEFFRSMRK